jgi:hypothetical protein
VRKKNLILRKSGVFETPVPNVIGQLAKINQNSVFSLFAKSDLFPFLLFKTDFINLQNTKR